jgi:hypothetical protein
MKYDTLTDQTTDVPESEGVILTGMLPKPQPSPTLDEATARKIYQDAITRKDSRWGTNLSPANRNYVLELATKDGKGSQLPVMQTLSYIDQVKLLGAREQSKKDAREYKLSSPAASMLENVDSALSIMGSGYDSLKSLVDKGEISQADMIKEWGMYRMHQQVWMEHPELTSFFESVSLADVIAASSYLHGMRNYRWVEDIKMHLPSVIDDPKLALQKMEALQQNMPKLRQAIIEWDLKRIQKGPKGYKVVNPGAALMDPGQPQGGSQPMITSADALPE